MISSEIGHTHTKALTGGVNGRSNCKDMATINITVFCNKVAMTKIKLGSSCFRHVRLSTRELSPSASALYQ